MKNLILIFLLAAISFSATARDIFVEGQILNGDQPAQKMTVKTSVSGKTTTTDKRGNFRIRNVLPDRDTLIVALDSAKTLAIALNGDNQFKITLRNDSIFIERDKIEVLQPQYGGTILSRKELEQGGETNLLQAISTKVTGVQYTNGNLLIRGFTSIRGRNTPLFVINGVHSYDASYLTVWDVETVEVVKGPSGAIFGSEGACGVVVIKLREKN
ncbi:MAG: Plug domain-containing protein [Prevotellaceae bacterium]|jgi:hypothetical protein|nr:Plug domain-containing protein [Prevotellaceae bacterium]